MLLMSFTLFVRLKFTHILENIVEKEIKSSVTTELRFEHLRINVFRNFPHVTLTIKDISIKAAPVSGQTNLDFATAGRLNLMLDFSSLLKKEYIVEQFELRDALINIESDSLGNYNYTIYQASDDTTSSELQINLQKGIFRNVRLYINDAASGFFMAGMLKKSELIGELTTDYHVTLTTTVELDSLGLDHVSYLQHQALDINAPLVMKSDFSAYTFSNALIHFMQVASISLNGILDLNAEQSAWALDYQADINDLEGLADILTIIPDKFTNEYNLQGELTGNGSLKGSFNHPDLSGSFSFTGGEIENKDRQLDWREINVQGNFENILDAHKGMLQVSSLKGRSGKQSVDMNFVLDQFDHLLIKGRIDALINLEEPFKLVDSVAVLNPSGQMELNTNFIGRISEWKSLKFGPSNALKGKIKLHDVGLDLAGMSLAYSDFDGELTLNGQGMVINNLQGFIADSEIRLNGKTENIFAYLSGNKKLTIQANFNSSFLNLDQLVAGSTHEEEPSHSPTEPSASLIPKNVVFDLLVDCKRATYKQVVVENIYGNVSLNQYGIVLDNVKMKLAGGVAVASGRAFEEDNGQMSVDGLVQLNGVNIHTLFDQFDNFGQDVLTTESIEGVLDARIKLSSFWNSDLSADLDKLFVLADFNISNGVLRHFDPLNSVFKYVKLKKVDEVIFENIENTILIKDRKIEIPPMDIVSNEFALKLGGSHGFDNAIDYRVKINLKELYFSKRNTSNPYTDYQDDGSGGVNLYLKMTGTVDEPQISYDKQAAGAHINQSLKQEKTEFLNLFRKNKEEKEEYELEWDDK